MTKKYIKKQLKFYPAKHNNLFIWLFQRLNSLELASRVKVNIIQSDIKALNSISSESGLILVANHSDELDPRVCMELSRRSGRRFTFMVNSEVFTEWLGTASWCLQHIGSFSIERGASDQVAIRYAIDTVKNNGTLLMFPEGEVSNLNDSVQPFKTGVIRIGMEAIKEAREEFSDWTVAILPITIKYRYKKNINSSLKKRIRKMEQHFALRASALEIKDKLYRIVNKLGGAETSTDNVNVIAEQLQQTRDGIVSEIEKRYSGQAKVSGDILDRAQRMIFFLRQQIDKKQFFAPETQKQVKKRFTSFKKHNTNGNLATTIY